MNGIGMGEKVQRRKRQNRKLEKGKRRIKRVKDRYENIFHFQTDFSSFYFTIAHRKKTENAIFL